MKRWFTLILLVGCDGTGNDIADAATDTVTSARCDRTKPFGAPVAITELNTTADDYTASLSPDELTIYFSSARPGGAGATDMYSATRTSSSTPFGAPTRIEGVNTTGHDNRPSLPADGLTLYTEVNGGTLEWNIASATRTTPASAFSAPTPVATLSSPSLDIAPFVLPDHSAIYFSSARSGDSEIYRASRSGGVFATPALVAGVNLPGTSQEDYPALTPDELVIYLASDRTGSAGADIWRASRPSTTEPFSAPVNVAALNTAGLETPGWVSADDCMLYFARSTAAGTNYDLFVATRPL
jgi:Tol biopolymer transport system component